MYQKLVVQSWDGIPRLGNRHRCTPDHAPAAGARLRRCALGGASAIKRERIPHFLPEKLTTTVMQCTRCAKVRDAELNGY